MAMTWTWWLVPLVVAGLGLVLAPVLGGLLARQDVWQSCPACGRELIGYPPEHRLSDRTYCRDIQTLHAARAAQRRSARAAYWRWVRGRRSP